MICAWFNVIIKFLEMLDLKEAVQEYKNKDLRKKLSPILSLWKKLNSGPQSLLKNKQDLQVLVVIHLTTAVAFSMVTIYH